MANQLFIKEFEVLPLVPGGPAQIWGEPCSVEQNPVTIGASHAESAAFNSKTKFVCITSDVDTSYLVSGAGTGAAITNFPLWSKSYLCFSVPAGGKISAIAWS